MKNISIEQSSFEQSVMIISVATISILLEEENGSDLIALYMFYQRQSKLQWTNISFTTSAFTMKWLGWWKDRYLKAKKILIEKNIIEDIVKKDEKWKIEWWYVKLNFIQSLPDAKLSSGTETHPVDNSTGGCQKTNAWSIKNINAWSMKSLNSEKEISEIPYKEKEDNTVQTSSSLYGSNEVLDTSIPDQVIWVKKKSKRVKKEPEPIKEHSEYKKITREEVQAMGGTKLKLRIIDIIESVKIYEDIEIDKFNSIYKLIIDLGKEAFPNVFYQDPETSAWYWTATILETLNSFIGYYQNHPEVIVLSLSGRLRTWFSNINKFKK